MIEYSTSAPNDDVDQPTRAGRGHGPPGRQVAWSRVGL